MNQYYEAEVVSEYVIRGNTAVLKCNIPSFVADFVRVDAWVSSEAKEFLYTNDYGNFFLWDFQISRLYNLPKYPPVENCS